jgi:hypothetical protein
VTEPVARRVAAAPPGDSRGRDADVIRVVEGVRSHRGDDEGSAFRAHQRSRLFVYRESFWNSRFGYGATVSVAILVLSIAVAALLLGKLFRGAFDV